jgi:hypothetical protein
MIVEIVCRETCAPWTSARCAGTSPGQARRRERDDQLVDAGQAFLVFSNLQSLHGDVTVLIAGTTS